jgi:CheY-like chemotaxis protein
MLAVTDTGKGMTPAVQAKAFEPFFTTKEIGKGTGLGLSQVYGVARQLGGTAIIRSTVDVGTSVEIWLPRDTKSGEIREDGGKSADAGGRRGTAAILVVDDDPDVREVIVTTLRGVGYHVVECDGAESAMQVLQRASGEELDLMLVDFAMPGTNGAELARMARRQRPSLRVVFLTGYADIDELVVRPDEMLVRKPFKTQDLVHAIERMLIQPANNRSERRTRQQTD